MRCSHVAYRYGSKTATCDLSTFTCTHRTKHPSIVFGFNYYYYYYYYYYYSYYYYYYYYARRLN